MKELWGKIFGKPAVEVIDTIGKTVDGLSTSNEEKAAAKQLLTETVMAHMVNVIEAQTSVINTEAQGNWLQRSWRPVLMLGFGFIIMYRYFLSQVFGFPAVELPDGFWDLLYFGMGGYVMTRSVEKVAETVTKNVDISFIKKKNRAQ